MTNDAGMDVVQAPGCSPEAEPVFSHQHPAIVTKGVVFFRVIHKLPAVIEQPDEVATSVRLFIAKHMVVEVLPAVTTDFKANNMLLAADGVTFSVDVGELLRQSHVTMT